MTDDNPHPRSRPVTDLNTPLPWPSRGRELPPHPNGAGWGHDSDGLVVRRTCGRGWVASVLGTVCRAERGDTPEAAMAAVDAACVEWLRSAAAKLAPWVQVKS